MTIKREKLAYEREYRIRNGIAYGLNNNIRKLDIRKNGYQRFTIIII